ncbi:MULTISPECIES: exosortase B [unclassified Roseateles]|uniref:exosortase B n=1 Tax=unclassified Roseateles TaxID=2626991 RepID=UPI0006FD547C|nr:MULTISPECIES: exosortase B [unclassified Roseateles]KQW41983.1 exosortase B [Pelomonas sp. Root405]KRA67586.1 exosortase B [Pelomonas sp. Root662]
MVPARGSRAALVPWLVAGLGLLALYVPTLISLFSTIWASDAQGHGPIVLGISIWLIYRRWPQLMDTSTAQPRPGLAWPLFVIAAFLYAVGRSQGIWVFEVGSAILVVSAIVLLLRGTAHVRLIAFALFFMLFMIPLPGAIVDALTQPMKMAVSYVAESMLHAVGYPISRSGVILQIGPYQLLVADACAGLHTLFTLEALGLLYLNIVRHSSLFRNIALAILIVPISFAANVIRVCTLTLITYYFGDEAGQGFLHGFAGMVLFISALLLIIATDGMLRFGTRRVTEKGHA